MFPSIIDTYRQQMCDPTRPAITRASIALQLTPAARLPEEDCALSSGSPNHFMYTSWNSPDLKSRLKAPIHDETKIFVVPRECERQGLVREEAVEQRPDRSPKDCLPRHPDRIGRSPKKTSELRSSTRWMPAS